MQRKTQTIILGTLVFIAIAATGFLVGRVTTKSNTGADRVSDLAVRRIAYWRAPMDPTEIHDKPGKSKMGMDLIPVYEDELDESGTGVPGASGNDSGLVRIDPRVSQNMGVRSAPVRRMDFTRTIRTVGKVDYDEEALVVFSARISGWIERLHVEFVGQEVRAGDALLEIYSPELVSTQQEYLLAFRNYQRAQKSGVVTLRDDAERLLASTRQRLEYWEIPSSVIDTLQSTGVVQRTITLRSPATGVVIRKEAIQGEHVVAGADLFEIADLSSVWIHASIYDDELPWIREGQTAVMDLSYLPGKEFIGRVSYVYPYLRDKARDAHARIIFRNANLELKPGMYVNIRLDVDPIRDALVIPVEAVIRSGARSIAFVEQDEGRFEPREIQIGKEGGENNTLIRVLSGLKEGEQVVTSAQFMLDSESRLQEAISKLLAARSATPIVQESAVNTEDSSMSPQEMEQMTQDQ